MQVASKTNRFRLVMALTLWSAVTAHAQINRWDAQGELPDEYSIELAEPAIPGDMASICNKSE